MSSTTEHCSSKKQCMFGVILVKRLFFVPLQYIEVEHPAERSIKSPPNTSVAVLYATITTSAA